MNDSSNKRLERTRHERASLVGCVGEPLKRNVMLPPEGRERSGHTPRSSPGLWCFNHNVRNSAYQTEGIQ